MSAPSPWASPCWTASTPMCTRPCQKVYDKICRYAQHLVKTGEDICPAVRHPHYQQAHLRHPHRHDCRGLPAPAHPVHFAKALDRAARTVGVNFIGGYSALVQKGFGPGDYDADRKPSPRPWPRQSWCAPLSTWAPPRRASTWTPWQRWAASSRRPPQRTADRECIGCGQAGGVLQRPGGQPLYGRRLPRRGRAGLRHQRGRLRPRRGAGRHQEARRGHKPFDRGGRD